MDDLKTIQDEIQMLAYEYFRNMDCSEDFSYPLVPRISEEYLRNRFVVMGQETNTWKGHIYAPDVRENFLEGSLAEYDRFVREEVPSYGGKFWVFSRCLYEKFFKRPICNGNALSYCWMNLFCIEKCVCRNDKDKTHLPSQNRKLAKRVMNIQHDFVYEVMKLIRPRIILAMIGKKNDDLFEKNVLGTDCFDFSELFEKKKILEYKICDEFSPLYGTLILRTYHPSYFMIYMSAENREKYKKIIYDRIETFLENSK